MKQVMMNRDKVKIKHLISIHKDLPEYPTLEDITFELSRWYFEQGGIQTINNNTSVDDTSTIVFTENILENVCELPKEDIKHHIDKLLSKNIITITKQTQHNTYYRFETNDYI